MADVAPNTKTDALKRRSTRIVQAVPLTVTGVDALGRPFEERTSTSIINCHGARYQSKHYVLKNMWVTLEVPHPEQGRPPRTVRGRVMWIQRPRTVRELFQVGIELEVPGNLWGIAFCPPDWFPFPDSESQIPASQVPPAEAPALLEATVPEAAEAAEPAEPAAAWSSAQEEAPVQDNLRTMPMVNPIEAGAEPSLAVARQIERLVDEAREQLRAAVRDHAAEAISAEAQPLLASLQNQLQEAAERSVQVAAATAAEQAIRNAVGNAEATAEARLRELIDRWNGELSRSLEQYHQKLEDRSSGIEAERRQASEQQFQSHVEQRLNELAAAAQNTVGNAEATAEAHLRELIGRWNDELAGSLEQYQQKLEVRSAEIEAARRQAFEQQFQSHVEQRLTELATATADSRNALERAKENLEALRRQAEDSVSVALRDGAQKLQAQVDDARTRVSELETVLRHSIEQMAPVSATVQTDWKAQLDVDEAAAAKRWDDRVEASLQNAAQTAAELIEKQLRERVAGISQTSTDATAIAEARLAAARASFENEAAYVQALLSQVQSASQPIAEQAAQLDALRENAQRELERRAADLVESQRQELARRGESALASWTERLEPSLAAAQQELERRAAALAEIQNQEMARRGDTAAANFAERLQPTLDAAQQELERRASALSENQSQELARRGDIAIANWTERLGPSLDAAQQELERRAAALAESQSQDLTRRGETALAAWAQRLQPSIDAAQQEVERRAAALVDIQSQEMARRGEISMAAWTERLQPSLEAAAQETVTRLGAQFEQHLGSHLDRASQVLGRLEYESLAAGEALLKREETLAATSNRIVEAATSQLQRQIETLEHAFQEAGRQAAAQWLAEVDSKATETTHTTFESLFKTAEWYEKKVQAHMQTTLERGLDQGVEQLRDKAGEISRLFAGELDHYSRSFVDHTREQIEEAGHQALEGARRQSSEMASTSISALAQQMHSGTDAALRDFHAKTAAALGKFASQVEEHAAQTRARIEVSAQRLAIDFGASITQQSQQALGSAKLELTQQANSARDSLRAEADAREKHLREALVSASDQGIETYKQRLESAANSWLLTTVSKLNQDSQQQLTTLTRAAEARLRDTCKQVFANVGEALRQQLLELPVSAPPKDSSTEKT